MSKEYDQFKRLLTSAIPNVTQSFYDSYVEKNTSLRARAGVKCYIIRRQMGRCCDWCASLAGIYEEGDAPDGIYQRHKNCKCLVTFRSEKGTYEDVWSKRKFETQRAARIARESEILKKPKVTKGAKLEDAEAKILFKKKWKLAAISEQENGVTRRIDLGEIDIHKKAEAVEYFNDQIKNELVENAIVITKNGQVIRFIGSETGVGLWDFEIEGAIIIHNHPLSNGILSFGADDFYFLRDNQNMAKFTCTNRDFTYTIEPIKDFSKVTYNELYLEAAKYFENKDFEIQDYTMRALAERGYVKYDKRRNN